MPSLIVACVLCKMGVVIRKVSVSFQKMDLQKLPASLDPGLKLQSGAGPGILKGGKFKKGGVQPPTREKLY